MTISVKEVQHVAKLARLALSEDETKMYAEQLTKIISFFDEINSVDTTGVEPMAHALPLVNVLREDKVIEPPGSALMLKNAPEAENGFFRVPKIGEA